MKTPADEAVMLCDTSGSPVPAFEKRRLWCRAAAGDRLVAAVVAGACGLVFLVAACLNPYDQAGQPLSRGTHRQLGLPPCSMLLVTGIPCMTCGMTTSFSLLMHGDVTAALRANWAGVFIATSGGALAVLLAIVALSGMQPRCFSLPHVGVFFTVIALGVACARYATVFVAWMMPA